MTDDNLTDIHSRIDRLEVTLTHAVDAIEKIANVVNKPQETKWGPILTAVGLLFVAASGYTTLITNPINKRVAVLEHQQSEIIVREIEHAYAQGRIDGIHQIELSHKKGGE